MQQDLALDFQAVFNAMPGNLMVLQPNAPHYTILAISDDLLRLSNFERHKIVGKSVSEVYPENPEALTATGPSALRASLQEVIRSKKPDQMPVVRYDIPSPTGEFEAHFWSASSKPVLDEHGEVLYIIHTSTNVTEKIKFEQAHTALKKVENAYNLFLQAPVAVCILSGPEYVTEKANSDMLRIWGKSSDIMGKPLFEVFPEAIELGYPDILDGVRKTGKPFFAKEHPSLVTLKGKEVLLYHTIVYQPFYEDATHSTPSGVFIVAHDVTEQVQARQKVEESEQKFRSLIEESPIATGLFTGRDLVVEVANEAILKAWGKGEAVLGMPLHKMLPELEGQPFLQILDDIYTTGIPFSAKAAEAMLVVDGVPGLYYFDFTYKPLFNGAGEVYDILNVAVDVTQQVHAQRQLQDQKEYLQNALDIADLGTFKIDIATDTGTFSQRLQEWFGLDSQSWPMDDITQRVHPEDREVVLQTVSDFLQREEDSRHDFTYRILLPNSDSVRYVRSIGKALFTDGKAHTIIGTIQDVSSQVSFKQKLEESEARFRNMVQQAPIAITLTRGEDTVIESINASMLRMMGKTSTAEVLGKKMIEVLPEVESQQVLALVQKVFATGEAFRGSEVPVTLHIGGEEKHIYVDLSYTPIIEDEAITGVLHVVIDVTEQVELRKKTEESARALTQLANAMPQIVWIAGAQGEVIYYNDRVSEFEGAEQLPDGTWSWAGLLHQEDLQRTVDAWEKAVTTGTLYEIEHRVQAKGGSFRWYLSRAYPQRDERGTIIRWYGTATDVHEQKENEEALKRFKFMADQARDPFILMREDGSFAYLNQKALQAWGYTQEAVPSLRVPDVDPIYTFDLFNEAFAKAQVEAIPQFETLHKRKDGHIYPVEINMVGLQLGGEPHLFAVARDITERQKSNEAMASKNIQLTRINNDLDNFIYTASHDLKSPISNIEGLLAILADDFRNGSMNPDETYQILTMMQGSVNRFKKTIQSLTDVVKLQQESLAENVYVNINEVIKEVKLDLEPMMKESGIQLEVDVADCGQIHFSEKNLRSVVYNLLSNAIKYRSPERSPWVLIRCGSTPQYHVLTVSDNGLGMSGPTHKLFTMFTRFHDHVEGTGIGLYMVKKMVENAGGHIEVETHQGIGSTFRVYFKH